MLLELKGIAYRIDPIVPFFGDEAFERLSPLRQIPVLVDGDFVLNDSSVICQYLEGATRSRACIPSTSASAPRPAGWRSTPIRGWAR